MRSQLLFASAVVTLGTLGGCTTDRPAVQAGAAPQKSAVGRAQDTEPSERNPVVRTGLLDALPDHAGEVGTGRVAARIRATVNGQPIFDEEVQAAAYQFIVFIGKLPEPEQSIKRREILKEALDQLIERELLIQDAFKRLEKNPRTLDKLKEAANKEFDRRWVAAMKRGNNIKTDDDLKESLRKQGLSLETIKRQWTRQFIATEYLRNRIMPAVDKLGHHDLVEYYESHPEEFKIDDTVEWQDIFISAANPSKPQRDRAAARKLAEEIATRARAGGDFVALCKQHDDGDSTLRNGAGIGRKRGEIQPPEIEAYLFRMPEGEVGPVVEVGNGFHVFRLVNREYAGKKPFDDATQKEINNKLRNDVFSREAKKIISDLKSRAVIEYARWAR